MNKQYIAIMSTLLLFVGVLLLGLTTVGAVGYFLYQWGALSLPLAQAAWLGFLFGVKAWLAGVASIILGVIAHLYSS